MYLSGLLSFVVKSSPAGLIKKHVVAPPTAQSYASVNCSQNSVLYQLQYKYYM